MAIILAVIKWIGILIGIVLGIVVVLAACVVWVPVRYRAEAVLPEQGEKKYAFSVSFLFHLISIKKKLDSEKVRIRIGFITVKSKEEKEKKETTEKKKTTSQKSEKKGKKVPEEQTQQKVPPRKKRTKKRFSFPGVSGIINFITDESALYGENVRDFFISWHPAGSGAIWYVDWRIRAIPGFCSEHWRSSLLCIAKKYISFRILRERCSWDEER